MLSTNFVGLATDECCCEEIFFSFLFLFLLVVATRGV